MKALTPTSRFWAPLLLCLPVTLAAFAADEPHGLTIPKDVQIDVLEGFIPIAGGQIRFRVVGLNKPGVPLLALHGGPPGTRSGGIQFAPIEPLADERPVIVYDRTGTGRSSPLDQADQSIAHFVAELVQVRAALGLSRVHLIGTSWGSKLLVDYLLTQPTGVVSAVFSNAPLSDARLAADEKRLKSELPPEISEVLARHETAGTTDSDEYKAANLVYFSRHWDRTKKLPASTPSSSQGATKKSETSLDAPAAKTERAPPPPTESFERADRLAEIHVPAHFIAGEFDFCTPEAAAYYQSKLPGAGLTVIQNASHFALKEQPKACCDALRRFLHEAETVAAP